MAEARRRKLIALKDKLLIVNDLEMGTKMRSSICRERDLPKSTVATIWASPSKLKNSVQDGVFFAQKEIVRCIPHVDVYNYVLLV